MKNVSVSKLEIAEKWFPIWTQKYKNCLQVRLSQHKEESYVVKALEITLFHDSQLILKWIQEVLAERIRKEELLLRKNEVKMIWNLADKLKA